VPSGFTGIQGKIIALVCLSIILTSAVGGYLSVKQLSQFGGDSTGNLREQMLALHQNRLKTLVDSAYSLLERYHRLAQSGALEEEEAKRWALAEISIMRYDDGAGYYWVHTATEPGRPYMVMHPMKPELDGQDISRSKDFDTVQRIFYQGEIYAKDHEIIRNNIQPTDLFVKMNELCIKDGDGFVKYYWSKAGEGTGQDVGYPKLSYVKLFKPWGWVLGTGVYIDDVDKQMAEAARLTVAGIDKSKRSLVLTNAACLAIALFLSVLLANRIVNPLKEMAAGVKRIAAGDLTVKISARGNDEVGMLARMVSNMAENLQQMVGRLCEYTTALNSHGQELSATAQQVTASMQEVAGNSSEVAAASQQGAANAESATEIARAVSGQARAGIQAVKESTEKMSSIRRAVHDGAGAVRQLGHNSARIGQIIETITGIADQTNLLALNAAIEAARAGEHGRGFAVVAEEVRKLAEQSSQAASEITGIIRQIKNDTEHAVKGMEAGVREVDEGSAVVEETGRVLERIIEEVDRVMELVEQVAAGARQSSEGIQQVAASAHEVSDSMQQVVNSSRELSYLANQLEELARGYKL